MNQHFAIKLLVTSILLGFCSIGAAFAQTVKGKVTDPNNQPLAGVSVFFKGTSTGVTTDANGNYSITSRNGGKTLVFSCLGMKEQEINIGNRSVINVALEEDSTFLDEAVAIGYSTVQRKDLMGSVASVNNKDIIQVPVLNFSEALAGKMAGVDVRVAEGDPDAPVEIKVRGTGSITQDSSPLFIVDGFPVTDISNISPSEIKSIDVLKDAFSTAIYGSRGAYGVVLITTKDGASGKVTVNYDGYAGVKKMARANKVQMMNPYEFALYCYEDAIISNDTAMTGSVTSKYEPYFGSFQDQEMFKTYKGNDWMKILFGQTGFTMSHNLNVSGNSDKTKWTFNYANLKEDAIMVNSSYLRHNLSLKANTSPVKNVQFNFSTRWSRILIQGAGANSINDKGNQGANGRLIRALRTSPVPTTLSDPDDVDDLDEEATYVSTPLTDVTDNDDRRIRENWNISGSCTWTILPGLKLKAEGVMDTGKQDQDRFYGLSSYYVRSKATILNQPVMESFNTSTKTYRASSVLSYNFANVLPKGQKLDILTGAEYMIRMNDKISVLAEGFPVKFTAEDARVYRGTAQDIVSSNHLFNQNEVLMSTFTRSNYSYKNRYSISGAVRIDGSSKFARGHRWGIFPSGAVSWNIGNEPFMKRVKAVNQLKLRYSFGAAGNNRIPTGVIETEYTASQISTLYGTPTIIAPKSSFPNADLKWETKLSHNLGLDFALFKTRVSGSVELYHNTTRDLLVNFPTSGIGYTSQYRNLGTVLNKGVETTLRFVVFEKRHFGLTIQGNIALNKNEVLKLGVDEIRSESKWASSGVGVDYIVREGQPLGQVYGYRNDGYYTIDDFTTGLNESGTIKWTLKADQPTPPKSSIQYKRPGTPKFKDLNGDGAIDDNDKEIIGNTLPWGTGGFSVRATLYGFDFNAAFNYSLGNDVYNAQAAYLSTKGSQNRKRLLREFTPGNAFTCVDWETGEQITDVDVLREVNANAKTWSPATSMLFMTDYFIEDASFLRLQSVTIGYTLPLTLTGRFRIKKIRFYATGNNLLCFTKYSGYDPEVNTRRSTPLTPGVDFSAYPKSIGIIGGINVTF
ncbi:MAG: TonB-dependent receptor [Bacteroidales bacterium]|nr:TonB-dependent receptor [Bacteroidales bacterium]